MMACSFLSYLDRQALAVLAPTILAETGLDTESYGRVVSCFSVAYMLGNPAWGMALDRIGLRAGMLLAVGVWSAASAAHAWMSGFWGFAAARTVLGLGEGATFPGGLRTAMDTLPPRRQSRGIAIAYSGGSLGAVLTPVLVVPVAVAFGWRPVFLLTGVLGLLWLMMWAWLARPPRVERHETPDGAVHWPNLRERRFWALVASYGLGASALAPMLYLAPLYLSRAHAMPQDALGRVLWIPPLGWEVGYFFWGWFADRFEFVRTRPGAVFLALAVCGLPVAGLPSLPSSSAVLALCFWTMFVASGFVVIALRTGARTYPRTQTALVAGIGAGAWSAIAAMLLPLLGRWFDQQSYGPAFWLVAALPAAGVALWWLFAPRSDRVIS